MCFLRPVEHMFVAPKKFCLRCAPAKMESPLPTLCGSQAPTHTVDTPTPGPCAERSAHHLRGATMPPGPQSPNSPVWIRPEGRILLPPEPPSCCQQVASYGGQPPNPTTLASIELASVDRAALLEGIEPSNNAGDVTSPPPKHA